MPQLFESRPEDEGLPGPQRKLAITVVMTGTTMAVLDASIVNVALPTIASTMAVDAARVIWVTNAYQLANAILLVALAALGDKIGYSRIYRSGLLVFTLASLACALAPGFTALVVARMVQGFGASAMMSIGPALYRRIFPGRLLGAALGLSALTVAASAAAGPMIGGLILGMSSWPWLFAINLPLGVVAILMGRRHLPPDDCRPGPFDIGGAVLSAIAMGCFVIAIDGLSKHYDPWLLGFLWTASLGAGAAFLRWQAFAQAPLLPLGLFSSRRFAMAAATSLCSFVGQGLAFVSLPFLFQGDYGYSPLGSGLLFTPWPLTVMVAAPMAGRLADRMSPRLLSTIGLGVFLLGLSSLAGLGAEATVPDILWRVSVCGLGFGFFQSPNNRELLGNVPRSLSGAASGVLASARIFGQSIGAAVAAMVLASAAGHASPVKAAVPVARIDVSLWIACGAVAGAFLVSALRTRDAPEIR